MENPQQNHSVSLGCGTLILIALIVIIFSDNDDDLEREVRNLRNDVTQLKTTIDAQSKMLEQIASDGALAASPSD